MPGTAVDASQYGQYADLRIGICNGEVCYSSRTVAGATPPLAESLIGSFLPVYVHRAMESNLSGYTIAAFPIWPLLVLTGWPVARWLSLEWAARYRFRRDRHHVGFEPILPGVREGPAAEPPGSDVALTPPAPASRTPGSASSARPR